MNKKAAVLAYPNSNNLGDYIQSIAAKQLLREEEVVELDRDNLDSYSGDPIKLVMNGWFMEAPSHWPPSEQIQPLFISFHLNPLLLIRSAIRIFPLFGLRRIAATLGR